MKKKWIVIVVLIAVALTCLFLTRDREMTQRQKTEKIVQMAQFLNDKYGYDLSAEDCVYFREEDYDAHGYLKKIRYDIPHIAIFQHGDERITVTDRNGFIGDDGQLSQLPQLLCGYFEEIIGLPIVYVEVRQPSNPYRDVTLNKILHRYMNEKLTSENIDTFMDLVWNNYSSLQLIIYFQAEENLEAQLDQITRKLGVLKRYQNLKDLRFYVTEQEALEIFYAEPRVLQQGEAYNNTEGFEDYVQGAYHVINPIQFYYPDTPVDINREANAFLYGGCCVMDRGYSVFFYTDREVTKVNNFTIVDLRDPK